MAAQNDRPTPREVEDRRRDSLPLFPRERAPARTTSSTSAEWCHEKIPAPFIKRYLLCTSVYVADGLHCSNPLKIIEASWSRNCIVPAGVGVHATLSRLFGKGDTDFGAQPWDRVLQEVLSVRIRGSGGCGFCRPSRLVSFDAESQQPRSIDSSGPRTGLATRAFSSRCLPCSPRPRRGQQAAGLSLLDHSRRRRDRGRASKCDGA
jgi:hypothetical protein